MSSGSLVSVVMAVFNGGDQLRPTVDSVLAQEDCDLEFVIVDDGSTDRTAEELASLAKGDSRVRLIRQENRGLTLALRRGCDEARGTYIARQDCGDLSLPGRLRAEVEALVADSRIAFVSCWSEFRGPRLEYLYTVRGTGRASAAMSILDPPRAPGLTDSPSCHPSVVFRKDAYEAVGGYRPEFYYGQDWDLWYRLAAHGWFRMIERPLYVVRVAENGISAVAVDAQRRVATLSLEAMRRRAGGESDEMQLQEAATIRPQRSATRRPSGAGAYFIGSCLFRNRDRASTTYLRRAIRAEPRLWKGWLKLGVAEAAIAVGVFR